MQPYIDERELGKSPQQLKALFKMPVLVAKKKTAHQVLVDNILAVAGGHPVYNYKYWVRRVAVSKLSMNAILDLVEKAKGLDPKYNKGGFIAKRL